MNGQIQADTRAVISGALRELAERVARRDLEGLVASFEPDGVLVGSTEANSGSDEIRSYLEQVIAPPGTLSWDWDESRLVAEIAADVIWFFLPGEGVVTDAPSANVERFPFRLTGVLRRGTAEVWRWAQFHGSLPQQ